MGESEWVRLTEEGVDGSSSHYSYRKGSVLWKHGLAWTSTRKQCGPLRRPDQFLTDAELDALAAHAPAVKALVEAARMLARSAALSDRELDVVRQEWGNTNVEVLRHWRDRTLDTLAAFEADDDPDRPLEDDEFQCG